jgi:hypothetical protein
MSYVVCGMWCDVLKCVSGCVWIVNRPFPSYQKWQVGKVLACSFGQHAITSKTTCSFGHAEWSRPTTLASDSPHMLHGFGQLA